MAQQIDMIETYYRKAQLPEGLRKDPARILKPEIMQLISSIESGTFIHSIILLSGLRPGKTVSAAALLRAWLKSRRDVVDSGIPGYFLPIHQLCYQNRTVDRYTRDENLEQVIRSAVKTDFLVMDGIFSYLTQNDDLLLHSIYDARQHSGKTTVVTTSITDPTACAGSVLYRIARDANIKVVY